MVNSGRNAAIVIITEKKIGRSTSTAAANMRRNFSDSRVSGSESWRRTACARWRKMFSTMMTVASTMMPRSIAPIDLRYRNSEGPHASEVDLGLKLPSLAAEHQHVGHSRHHAQPSLHHPVLQRLELHHVHLRRPFELVAEDLADGACWRDHRLHALRQVSLPQAIYCLLAHEVVVAAVFELQPNETERVDGVGADVSKPGRTGDRDLDRNRDVTFHLLGRLPWPLRDDLDDRRRGIGIGLDVECGEGYKAQAEIRRERDQHERAPQQAEGNQTTQHSASIGPAIDSPQIGQRHCVEGNRAVRRMGDDPEGTIPGPTTA